MQKAIDLNIYCQEFFDVFAAVICKWLNYNQYGFWQL